jgi:hypothetical protein
MRADQLQIAPRIGVVSNAEKLRGYGVMGLWRLIGMDCLSV